MGQSKRNPEKDHLRPQERVGIGVVREDFLEEMLATLRFEEFRRRK